MYLLLKSMAHEMGREGSFSLDLHTTLAPELQVRLEQLAKVETLAITIGFTLDLRGEDIIYCGSSAVSLPCIGPEPVDTQLSELVWNERAAFLPPGISCSALWSPRENPRMSQREVLRLTRVRFWAQLYGGRRLDELLAHQCGTESAWHVIRRHSPGMLLTAARKR